jgi:hypothetical protein
LNFAVIGGGGGLWLMVNFGLLVRLTTIPELPHYLKGIPHVIAQPDHRLIDD